MINPTPYNSYRNGSNHTGKVKKPSEKGPSSEAFIQQNRKQKWDRHCNWESHKDPYEIISYCQMKDFVCEEKVRIIFQPDEYFVSDSIPGEQTDKQWI